MTDFRPEWLSQHFPTQPPRVIFDVGAYDAHDAAWFHRMTGALVVAFEASRRNFFERCLYQCRDLRLIHAAVSDENGLATFHDSAGDYQGSGSLLPPVPDLPMSYPGMQFLEPYAVPTVRLDTFVERTQLVPDLLHIDAQGAEMKVLRGLGEAVRPKLIFLETSACGEYQGTPSKADLIVFTLNLGYRLQAELPSDALFVRVD